MAKSKANTIMLVDDDQQHNEMLKSFLQQKFRFNIQSCSTGEEALAKIPEVNPSFVVLDYYLDKNDKTAKNGMDVLKEIKKLNPDLYVVMMSGQDKIEVAVDTMKYGAYDYVIKNASGFLRIENVLKNILHNMKLKFQARSYRFATFFLGGAILLIIIMAILLKILGISTENLFWS